MKFSLATAFVMVLATWLAQAGEPVSGLVYGLVDIRGETAEVEIVHATLPESVVEQLRPVMQDRARRQAKEDNRASGRYAVGIDWKLVEKDGRRQLAFDFSNGPAQPLKLEEAQPPVSMYSVNQPVSATVNFRITASGEIEILDCTPSEARFGDACVNASRALKKSVYAPMFVNGIGRADVATKAYHFTP